MKLKKKLKAIRNLWIKVRCTLDEFNEVQGKANLYTEGNLSEYVRFACLNFEPTKDDLEEPKKGVNDDNKIKRMSWMF